MMINTCENPAAGWYAKHIAPLIVLFFIAGIADSCNAQSPPDVAERFVGTGWHVGDEAKGDLNGDGLEDLALALDPDDNNHESGARILLVLIRKSDGTFEKVVSTDRLLVPEGDHGMSGGLRMSIDKQGVLIIDELVGARYQSNGIWRFRLDPKTGRMRLIGFDMRRADVRLPHGTSESTNYLTGKRITKTWRFSEKKQASVLTNSKTTSVAVPKTFPEDETYERLRWDDNPDERCRQDVTPLHD